ncbi:MULTISPECIES: SulP family inorganic anion transporter [sulfur-oxidizing symbionts]|jgi:SulP family sulfate permease|uniref:Sulfate permease family and related transporter n=3 Tax=Gammaproteobacteria TaxID=1236 RepID=G2FFR5_9GAMM|nr:MULTISPECIES: SulP family inorganic anion transporter [sulfur-oxidizing symbionts]EGV49794.1 high affinity sulfate transporter [endosymbiont of Riftia pachyptila (vent Ph05)]EGW54317.1 sulfate permease family and related transporter [endosymbiont of Tevnia jerichonana (vent Tica)]USF87019.1 SulP family inorganic anion transporter [Candidatus Endoriftia persephone]
MFQLTCPGRQCVKNDTLSGLTVALALVPEAIAFAFVAGVEPLVGLYAAFMMGIITSIIGGRPGMISGATGAMAVVMVSLVAQHGVEYLFAAVLLAGLIQILSGVLRLGKFIRMVPHPVMLGFVNGLAIVIFLAQLQQFQVADADGNLVWMSGEPLLIMLGLVVLTMAIIHFLPKLTSALPASLVAIVSVTLLVFYLDLDARTVQGVLADMSGNPQATIAGGLPEFHIPMVPFSFETLYIILPYAVILAAVGLIESLLTLSLIDELTESRGRGNKECIGQGVANTVNGLFGGMGGCAMIGQSMININSGGRGRLSGISAALFLLTFILVGSSLIEMIPVAALVGVMFIVVLGTFEWASFRLLGKIPLADTFVGILVAVVTVLTDLAIAVIVGVIVSALVFAWEHAKHIYAKTYVDKYGIKHYEISGPLFFGSVQTFADLFNPKDDPDEVMVDFANARVYDHSGLEAIDALAERYTRAEKRLHIKHLSQECQNLLVKAGDLVEVNMLEDPRYHVADDRLA